MDAVIYYSCTGNGKKVAKEIAGKTAFEIFELTDGTQDEILSLNFNTAVIVFPIHCQSYPAFMRPFFKRLNAGRVALVATYGRIDAGNAVYEAAKLLKAPVVAALYLPARHSYLQENYQTPEVPQSFFEKLGSDTPAKITKRRKTPFAGCLPSLRSRAIIKIKRSAACTGCNLCKENCTVKAVDCGKTNARCVRCLKCVYNCPQGALTAKKSRTLSRYLKRAKHDEIIIYI
ncbi:MAG: hypothetical protein K2O44_01320 [Clostridia bacterium]|nr:hypothetical protein [Clostridia bacterium]